MHTYLAVGDVKDVTVEGLDGARYFDKVRGRFATQVGDVTFVGPTDRVYTTTQQVQVSPQARSTHHRRQERLGLDDRVESLVAGGGGHERRRRGRVAALRMRRNRGGA